MKSVLKACGLKVQRLSTLSDTAYLVAGTRVGGAGFIPAVDPPDEG